MGCGCNQGPGAPAPIWLVQYADGSSKAYQTAVGANADAARNPGSYVIPPPS